MIPRANLNPLPRPNHLSIWINLNFRPTKPLGIHIATHKPVLPRKRKSRFVHSSRIGIPNESKVFIDGRERRGFETRHHFSRKPRPDCIAMRTPSRYLGNGDRWLATNPHPKTPHETMSPRESRHAMSKAIEEFLLHACRKPSSLEVSPILRETLDSSFQLLLESLGEYGVILKHKMNHLIIARRYQPQKLPMRREASTLPLLQAESLSSLTAAPVMRRKEDGHEPLSTQSFTDQAPTIFSLREIYNVATYSHAYPILVRLSIRLKPSAIATHLGRDVCVLTMESAIHS